MDGIVKFENLDTSYVNLPALLRYLRDRNFTGRVHVALDQYEADVFLFGSQTPGVRETDHSTGRGAQGDAAMDRLLVRSREPGGLISVYERAAEAKAESAIEYGESSTQQPSAELEAPSTESPEDNVDWGALLTASGELIGAVERAVQTTGAEFADYFRAARIELGDDYPYLDPTMGHFEYTNSSLHVRNRPPASDFVTGLTECLRRVVNKLAAAKDGARFRERVAVELALAVRRQPNGLAEFAPHLNAIAGTRVL